MRLTHVEGAVLAGGRSSRMGRDKARLRVDGVALVERVSGALAACVERVSIVVRPGAEFPTRLPLRRIDDRAAVRAPIAGLHAALRAAHAPSVLIAACDLPNVEPRFLLALLALVPESGGPDAVVPLGPRGPEPLLAVYRKRILPAVEERIARDALALHELIAAIDATLVPEAALRAIDPELASLRNANRPEDLIDSYRSR